MSTFLICIPFVWYKMNGSIIFQFLHFIFIETQEINIVKLGNHDVMKMNILKCSNFTSHHILRISLLPIPRPFLWLWPSFFYRSNNMFELATQEEIDKLVSSSGAGGSGNWFQPQGKLCHRSVRWFCSRKMENQANGSSSGAGGSGYWFCPPGWRVR